MRKKTIKDISDFIGKNGGKCLSKSYSNNKSRLNIMCEHGHTWETNWMCLNKGTWCPHCKKDLTKLSILEAEQIAKKNNGYCLSTNYKNVKEKLEWKCSKGHVWLATFNNIKYQKQWCPKCAGRKKTIEDMHEIARENGGQCLSEHYTKSDVKLKWKCKENHIWEATPSSIINAKSWCPFCKESRGENACRIIFQQIFGKSFKKMRPNWLKNEDGYNLEIDGINLELKIAFEYNGKQHRKMSYFANEKELIKIKKHDKIKKYMLKKHGIKLIVIEQDSFNLDSLIEQISKKINKHIPDKKEILLKLNKSSKIEDLHNIAKLKGGKCLSDIYINSSTKIKWECKQGHEWMAKPNTIKNGHWCQKCFFKDQKGKNKGRKQ